MLYYISIIVFVYLSSKTILFIEEDDDHDNDVILTLLECRCDPVNITIGL